MPWIEVLGQDIYYLEAGQGQPLVFLHGMSSCGEAWWQQFEAFAADYRVIAFDSVNHGHSSNSPRDQEEPDRTDELEAVLAALGVERPVLLGNSMGGATILRWAARHPGTARALVVSGMGVAARGPADRGPAERGPADRGPADRGPARNRNIEPLDPEVLFLPIGDSLTQKLRDERPRMYERYLRIRSTATRLEYMRHPRPRSEKTVAETDTLLDRLPAVSSPMLVIIGSLDGLVPNAKRLQQVVPGAQYVEIEGAPHNVYWEAAAAWNSAVRAFLETTLDSTLDSTLETTLESTH
ncbi:MAG: alpha/beta fold hydrolase [Pseudomonadota bacterium]